MAIQDGGSTNRALETGGNLAQIATNTTGIATAAAQTAAQTSLTSIESRTRVDQADVLLSILIELRAMNYLLRTGLNVSDELEQVRSEAQQSVTVQ